MTESSESGRQRTLLSRIVPRFGDIAKALGLLKSRDVREALRRQEKGEEPERPPEKIGAFLVERGKMTDDSVRQVLEVQREVEEARLASPEEVKGFLKARKEKLHAGRAPSLEGLGSRLDDLEQKLVTRQKVEEIAAGAALDVLKLYESEMLEAIGAIKEMTGILEKREFARKVAEILPSRVCRREIEELVADMVHYEFEQALESKAKKVFAAQLETPEFTRKLKDVAGAAREVDVASKRLAKRLDKIEQEALPERVERLFNEKLEEKFGDVSAESIAEKLDVRVLQGQFLDLARDVVGDIVKTPEFRSMLDESLLQATLRDVVNTPQFKSMLDERFKAISDYISQEVIPKRVEGLEED